MTLKGHCALCYANRAVLWLNDTSTIASLDTAMTSYRLSTVTMFVCSSLAAILNAMLLPAAITHVRTVSYPGVDCSRVAITCMGLQLLWEIAFFPRPEVGRQP